MSKALPVGYFQFDNLVKGRVPFLLLRPSIDVEAPYGIMEKMHLRNFSVVIEKLEMPEAQTALDERKARKEDPIVVLDENGKQSEKLAHELTVAGYINVYFVLGGWQEILHEMQAAKA